MQRPEIKLRLATMNDIQTVWDISQHLLDESCIYLDLQESKFRSTYVHLLNNPDQGIIILAVDIDEIVGCIVGQIYSPPFSDTRIATEIVWYVYPDVRRTAGMLLLRAYEHWAREVANADVIQVIKQMKIPYGKNYKNTAKVFTKWA